MADLKKLEASVQGRILRAIETKLLPDPFRHGRKLTGKSGPGRWRYRVGDYRIRFDWPLYLGGSLVGRVLARSLEAQLVGALSKMAATLG